MENAPIGEDGLGKLTILEAQFSVVVDQPWMAVRFSNFDQLRAVILFHRNTLKGRIEVFNEAVDDIKNELDKCKQYAPLNDVLKKFLRDVIADADHAVRIINHEKMVYLNDVNAISLAYWKHANNLKILIKKCSRFIGSLNSVCRTGQSGWLRIAIHEGEKYCDSVSGVYKFIGTAVSYDRFIADQLDGLIDEKPIGYWLKPFQLFNTANYPHLLARIRERTLPDWNRGRPLTKAEATREVLRDAVEAFSRIEDFRTVLGFLRAALIALPGPVRPERV